MFAVIYVTFKSLQTDDFSHANQRTRLSRLKTVMTILRKVVPPGLKLHDGYEEYIATWFKIA